MSKDYDYIGGLLKTGSTEQLEEVAELVDDFPDGEDDFTGRRWIRNAVDFGSSRAIAWMLEKKVDLAFSDDEGYPVLLSAIESDRSDKYEILELLLQHGAPTDMRGINDYATPLEVARMLGSNDAVKYIETVA